MTFKRSIVLDITTSLLTDTVLTDIKTGFVGSLNSNTGLSILHGAGTTIEGTNAVDGMNDGKSVLASTDASEDITEGVRTCEYLIETEEVGFTIFESIDDVNLDWLPRVQEFQIPTLDTWTSYVGIIGMVIEDPETTAPYFMNIASDGALITLYTNSGADMLKKEMGWGSVVTLAEDTTPDEAVTGLVTEASGPAAGIKTREVIAYNAGMVDFASLLPRAQASGTDFTCQISLVNS